MMHSYYHNIGDYAKDTRGLTLREHGVYRLLIDTCYSSEKPLPSSRHDVCKLLDTKSFADRTAVDKVLERFFVLEADGYHQKRCDEEIDKFRVKSNKAAASAAARWGQKNNANAMRTHEVIHANAMRTHRKPDAKAMQAIRHTEPSLSQPSGDNGNSATSFAQRLRDDGVKIEDQDPLLAAWSAMAPNALTAAIERARQYKPNGIPAAYLATVIEDLKQPNRAWQASENATIAKGAEVGVFSRAGESWDEFRQRIERALAEHKRN